MLEILQALRDRQSIPVTVDEVDAMESWGLVTVFERDGVVISRAPAPDIEGEFKKISEEFRTVSDRVRERTKDMSAMENQIAVASIFQKISLKQRLSRLKNEARVDGYTLDRLKNQMMTLSIQRERGEQRVQMGSSVLQITLVGESMIDEIAARPAFESLPFYELANALQAFDEVFDRIMNNVAGLMIGRKISAIWAPYLIDTGMAGSISSLGHLTSAHADPHQISRSIMSRTMEYLYNRACSFQIQMTGAAMADLHPSGATAVMREVEGILGIAGMPESDRDVLRDLIAVYDSAFSNWDPARMSADPDCVEFLHGVNVPFNGSPSDLAKRYLENLARLKEENNPLTISPADTETVAAALILGFADDPSSLEYFENLFSSVPVGKHLFSAIATILPWSKEEAWAVLRRAESAILLKQSASFVPELVQYAFLLSMHPDAMALSGNVSPVVLATWRYMLIPVIQASFVYVLEGNFQSFVINRPNSYIIAPRAYYFSQYGTSRLHQHMVG
jgi:hypothetical protein